MLGFVKQGMQAVEVAREHEALSDAADSKQSGKHLAMELVIKGAAASSWQDLRGSLAGRIPSKPGLDRSHPCHLVLVRRCSLLVCVSSQIAEGL